MKKLKIKYIILTVTIIILVIFTAVRFNLFHSYSVGEIIDSYNNVNVYYNGNTGNISGRNKAKDGYNLGLKYQCVEFVKRYYYEHLNHKMPDSYGHAKDFFDKNVSDGKINKQRNLIQYTNPGKTKPKESDLLVFDATSSNRFGHVAIVCSVTDSQIELIQQNPGRFGKSRIKISLIYSENKWTIDNDRILGWLRKP